ncbi:MAG TPA: hypothetical protein VE441_05985 [Mycobacterium sp.]|nr:hypothetical protein [Mycobacterium sp.]
MRFSKKAMVATAAGAALAVAAGGMALAYWTSTGAGTGTAATSPGASDLTITQTSTLSPMFPGDAAQTISGTVTNNAANAAYVTSVNVSISSVTQAAGSVGSCDASDYTLSNPLMVVNKDVASGGNVAFTGATLKFNNKATNQDGCKGATVNLAYASN